MATTSTAPISIPQINRYYYVGEAMLRTIQQAVNYAVADSNAGTVVIPQEYAGTDTIAAVTGGSATVFLVDERNGQRKVYLWYHGAYVEEPISPNGIGTSQINHSIFVGQFTQYQTIQSAINQAALFPTQNFLIVIQPNYQGSEDIGALIGGSTAVYLSDQRTSMWQNYNWNGANYVATDFEPLGAIIADSISTNLLAANDAEFETCIVDNSPVRTFANTADGVGPSYPPPGIGISTGTAWGDTSINPATLATWPAVGIPVSSGAAWGTSIDPATVPRLGLPNVFTAFQTAPYYIASGNPGPAMPDGAVLVNYQASTSAGQFHAASTSANLAEIAFGGHASAASGGRYLQYFNFSEPTGVGSASANFNVPAFMPLGLHLTGTNAITWTNQTATIDFELPTNSLRLMSKSDNTLLGQIQISGASSDADGRFSEYAIFGEASRGVPEINCLNSVILCGNGALQLMNRTYGQTAGTPNINTDGVSIIVNPAGSTGILFLNWDQGGGGVRFGNGVGGPAVGQVDAAGNAQFNTVTMRDLSTTGNDFNSMTTGGFYIIGPNANAPPSGDTRNFVVFVMASPSFQTLVIQMAWNFNIVGEIWTRTLFFGTWTQWFRFTTTPSATQLQGGPKGPLPLPAPSDKEPLLDAPITPGPDRDRTAEAGKRSPQKSVARKPDATSQGRTHKSR